MAGYALGFEDGGAIPDQDEVDPTGESGPAPAAAPQQEPQEDPTGESGPAPTAQPEEDPGGARLQAVADAGKQTPMEGIKQFPGNMKRIVSYLMGDGAAEPEAAEKFALGVKHEYPNVSPDDANLLAVQKAFELGGPGAAWQMMQFNRSAYNAKQSFAEAALQGVQGKAPDPHAAADAATKASQHVLDGSTSNFTADNQGFITATVKLPGNDTPQNYRMSPDQFRQYVNVGKDGQYDKLIEMGGIPGTLQRIVGQAGKGGALPTQSGAPDAQGGAPTSPDDDRMAQLKKVMGDYPISQDDVNSGYDPDTIAKGYARFGHGIGQTSERNEWMAQQDEKAANRENQVTVAQEKGKLANERARITGTGNVEREKVKSQGGVDRTEKRNEGTLAVQQEKNKGQLAVEQQKTLAQLKKLEQQAKSQEERERYHMARTEIANPNYLIQKEDERAAIRKKYGLELPGETQATGAAPAAPSKVAAPAAPPQKPPGLPDGAKFYKGKWYTRGDDGSAVPFESQ